MERLRLFKFVAQVEAGSTGKAAVKAAGPDVFLVPQCMESVTILFV